MHRTEWMDSQRATGANMNVKSCPKIWMNPLAMSQPSKCDICPFWSHLIWRTHLHWTAFLPGGSSLISL